MKASERQCCLPSSCAVIDLVAMEIVGRLQGGCTLPKSLCYFGQCAGYVLELLCCAPQNTPYSRKRTHRDSRCGYVLREKRLLKGQYLIPTCGIGSHDFQHLGVHW